MRPAGLTDLFADFHHRIKGKFGILHDHGNTAAPDFPPGTLVCMQEIQAVKVDAICLYLSRWSDKTKDGPTGNRLAGAGLSHNSQFLPPHGKTESAHRLHRLPVAGKADS